MRRVLLAVILLALLPATARAGGTFYVSPTGGDTTCSHDTPCSVAHFFDNTGTAMGHYADGDTIIVEPGTYDATLHNFLIQHAITLMGDPALPRPVITGSQPQSTEYPVDEFQGQGTHVSHLDIRATNTTGVALHGNAGLVADDLVLSGGQACVFINGGSVTNSSCTVTIGTSATGIAASGLGSALSHLTVDTSAVPNSIGISTVTTGAGADTISDVTVRAGNTGIQGGTQATIRRANIVAGNFGVILGQSSLLSDSLVTTTGGTGSAIAVNGQFAEMRNVTAVARGAAGDGVVALPNMNQAFPYGDVHVRSSIIRASPTGVDVQGQAVGSCPFPPCHTGQVTIDHSDYVTSDGTVTTDASNTSADPLFVDLLGLDFHLRDASPAIDTGLVDASSGTTDVTGAARTQGTAPDMGAYERAPAPVPPPATTPVRDARPHAGSRPHRAVAHRPEAVAEDAEVQGDADVHAVGARDGDDHVRAQERGQEARQVLRQADREAEEGEVLHAPGDQGNVDEGAAEGRREAVADQEGRDQGAVQGRLHADRDRRRRRQEQEQGDDHLAHGEVDRSRTA